MNGSCECGAISFTTPTDSPMNLYHCHCTTCQKQSASAFGTSAIFPYFELTTTTHPSIRYFERNCDSGRRQKCYFCGNCGTRIMHAHIVEEGTPQVVAVKGGLLEGLNWKDAKHIYCRSAVYMVPEGVERWEGTPAFGPKKDMAGTEK